jgi:hypothetical protein
MSKHVTQKTQGSIVDQQPDAYEAVKAPAPKDNRITFEFVTPARVYAWGRAPERFSMSELTPNEMAQARKAAGDTMVKTEAMAKRAIATVDNVPVNHAEHEEDVYWSSWSAKFRSLVIQAFAKIHATEDEDDADFLSSMTPKGG